MYGIFNTISVVRTNLDIYAFISITGYPTHIMMCVCFVFLLLVNRIGGAMVSVLASIAVDHGFESQSGQTKNYV